jgi:hypothetical protein
MTQPHTEQTHASTNCVRSVPDKAAAETTKPAQHQEQDPVKNHLCSFSTTLLLISYYLQE